VKTVENDSLGIRGGEANKKGKNPDAKTSSGKLKSENAKIRRYMREKLMQEKVIVQKRKSAGRWRLAKTLKKQTTRYVLIAEIASRRGSVARDALKKRTHPARQLGQKLRRVTHTRKK